MQSARTDLWKFEQLATLTHVYSITKIHEREFTTRPDSYRTENITADDLQKPISAGENANSLSTGTFVHRCKFARTSSSASSARVSEVAYPPNAFRQKDDPRSTLLANAIEENRRNMKTIDLRSCRFQQECSTILLTGARRLNWIDIMKTTYVYIMLLGNRDSLWDVL